MVNLGDPATEVAAHVAADIIKSSLSSIYNQLGDFITVKRTQYFERFNEYCILTLSKNSSIRTLYSKNKPVPLSEVYVKTRFNQDGNQLDDNALIQRFQNKKRIIVKGNGGSGKTIFLKHLWMEQFQNSSGSIPVYVELRRLNDLKTIDLESFCKNELQSDSAFGKGVFEKLCEAGRFDFIFDGFDEVSRDNRKTVERQIIALSDTYRGCRFLVSGREDDRFTSWSDFEIYSVSPLSLGDARILINKIPFDRKVKKKFLETLTEDFYKKHRSFLSSPLLTIMMLMTFNENAIIPSKLTDFYKSAFQTLLTWHDATKDSFERDRSLSVDNFRKVFATFCLITYYDQAFEFDEASFRKYIEKSLKYHKVDADIDSVKNDVCESANLLQRDGLKYVFVHRSFQEYFAAECSMQIIAGKASEFLEVFSKRYRDAVFAMCYEIHPELVFDQYFSPKIDWMEQNNFLPSSKAISEHGPCLCDSIEIACRALEDGRVQPSMMSIRPSETAANALRIINLGQQVTQTKLSLEPHEILFHVCYRLLNELCTEFFANQPDSAEIKIVVSFSRDEFKVNVRNVGTTSIDSGIMRPFRTKFVSRVGSLIKKERVNIGKFFTGYEKMFSDLKSERSAKLKSIDDILGI